MKTVVNEGFYAFAQERYNYIREGSAASKVNKDTEITDIHRLLYNLTPVIPKVIIFEFKLVPVVRQN